MTSQPPVISTYARHIFICASGCDTDPKQANRVAARLSQKLGETNLNSFANPRHVRLSMVNCLGVCSNGTIMVVYPEGVWYRDVDETMVDRIVEEHLINDQPVQEIAFHQMTPGQTTQP
jgi:(2Fe-2S) ferredoxin